MERYWTHHTCAALESAIASTVKGAITLSTDVVDSNLSILSSTIDFSDDSDLASTKAKPLTPKMKATDLQQRGRKRKRNNLQLKLSRIAPPILKQQGTRPSQRILEMFAELVESRMESCEHVTKAAHLVLKTKATLAKNCSVSTRLGTGLAYISRGFQLLGIARVGHRRHILGGSTNI